MSNSILELLAVSLGAVGNPNQVREQTTGVQMRRAPCRERPKTQPPPGR